MRNNIQIFLFFFYLLLTHISYLFIGRASLSFRWHRHIRGRAAGLLKAPCVPEDWLTGGGFTSTSQSCLPKFKCRGDKRH